MDLSRADKAIAMLRGVATRDAALATRHVSTRRYVEHNPSAADGLAGLRDDVARLSGEDRLEVVRVLAEEDFVVLHGQRGNDTGDVFFDVFRFEDEFIVEHWTFSAPLALPNLSGHTQIDGPTAPKRDADTEANKALVEHYYRIVHLADRHDALRRFMSGDVQIRHEPGVQDGVAAFEADLARLTLARTIDEIVLLLGQGDLVFIAARGTHEGRPCAYIDLYRVEDGKLVEHWGFPEQVPPQEERRNGNGVL